MGSGNDLSSGDSWPDHYRGFRLTITPDNTIWWQLYNGTDRLELDREYSEITDSLIEHKPQGGRVHVTELGDVLTRVENSNGDYDGIYLGSIDLNGELQPGGEEEFSVPLRPSGLSKGDLWPSVYDGSRYSFAGDRVWWNNGSTNRRHPVENGVPDDILGTLKQYKREGGSFRVTPWGDVITLIPSHPATTLVQDQFGELPRVVQNIIKLRKERGVEMLPIYVGNVGNWSPELSEPNSLADSLSEQEQEELASWASGLGSTTQTTASSHTAATDTGGSTGTEEVKDTTEANDKDSDEGSPPKFDDDPMDWIRRDIDSTEE